MKDVYILRAVSGAGKSTIAKKLSQGYKNAVTCEADVYFIDNTGKYNFDASKLGAAHAWCRSMFENALEDESVDAIIVSNTNTSSKEFKTYEALANSAGCNVFFLVIENRHGNNDVHGVPNDIKENQEKRIKNSLKLV